jgi:hypothetical protein
MFSPHIFAILLLSVVQGMNALRGAKTLQNQRISASIATCQQRNYAAKPEE